MTHPPKILLILQTQQVHQQIQPQRQILQPQRQILQLQRQILQLILLSSRFLQFSQPAKSQAVFYDL
jgi:hypothetical protein